MEISKTTVRQLAIQYDFEYGVSSIVSDWLPLIGDMLPTRLDLSWPIANIKSGLLLS